MENIVKENNVKFYMKDFKFNERNATMLME